MDRATGWHYHTCDMQFVYILRGWVDLEFAGGRKARFGVGDSVMIPGGRIYLPGSFTPMSRR